MTEPKRWFTDDEGPKAARELLRVLHVPTPPSAGKQSELAQKLATLTASAGVVPASSLGGWLKLGLVCGACIGVGALLTTELGTAPPPVIPSIVPSAPLPVVAPTSPGETPTDTPPVTDAIQGNLDQPSPVALPAPTRQKAMPRDALGEEEALLERARRLTSSDPRAASALLNKHGEQFPEGQLAAERMFLSVDVLERLGNTRGALAQATALTRRFPDSAYAVRVRERLKQR